MRRFFAIALLIASMVSICVAQLDQGQIAGTITDTSQAIVPGAKVTATSLQTRVAQATESGSNGGYILTNLPVGIYELVVESPGFKKFVQSNVKVDAASRTPVNVSLELGAVTETVNVTATAEQVLRETAQIGRVIEARQISDLALNGRNPINLALMKAGVTGGNFNSFNPDSLGMSLSINGGQTNNNAIVIDGINAVRTRSGTAPLGVFNVDTIQEVQILTANYPAEYGRASDGQIRFVSKSGTREFHGTLYHFLRNSALDANSWTRNQSPNAEEASKPAPFQFNQPGYSIGGPIFIPGIFNSDRNKLFFFVGQEWVRFHRATTSTGITPSVAMRKGDFSELLSASNPFFRSVKTILDPDNNTPFSNNIIPTGRLSTNGIGMLNAYPLPVSGFQQGPSNWIGTQPAPRDSRKDLIRIDYYAGKHRLAFSGSNYAYVQAQPFRGNFDTVGTFLDRPNRTGSISLTSTLSPTLINEATFSASVDIVDITNDESRPFQRSKYGITYPYIFPGTKDVDDKIPTIQITGLSTLDGGPYPAWSSGPMYNWSDNLTWVVGSSHTFKFGVSFERAEQNNGDQIVVSSTIPGGTNNQNGKFEFLDSGISQGTGLGLGNAALGRFNSYGEIGKRAYTLLRSNAIEAFAQDTWKLRPNLTLEIGVRYSYYQPWHAAWNDIANFDATLYDASERAIVDPVGGYILSGDRYNGVVLPGSGFPTAAKGRIGAETLPDVSRLFHGLPDGLVDSYKNAFAPRLGLAYSLNSKTILRAGFGIYHNRNLFYSSYLFGNPPNQLAVGVTNGQADAPGGVGVTRDFPLQIRALDAHYKYPTANTYSFSIQREISKATVLELAYVGKNSINLRRSRNLNQMAPGTIQANPGKNPDFLRPYHGLGIITLGEYTGRANYQSFQMSLDRRFNSGLGFGVSYTFSKNIDNLGSAYDAYNTNILRSLSNLDIPHVLNINGIYELPLLQNRNDLAGLLLGGWQLSGVATFRSGSPLSVVDSVDVAGVGPGSGSQPWDLVGNTEVSGDRGLGLPWFNTGAFARPASGKFGTAGLNILRGPGFQNWDAALFKNFRVTEMLNCQFRFEVFNFPNHPVLNNPGVSPRSGSFGLINSKSNERNLQLGLKLIF